MSNDEQKSSISQRMRDLEARQLPDSCVGIDKDEFLELLDKIDRLTRLTQSQKVIIDGMDRRNALQGRELGEVRAAASDIAGERAANQILTNENEALRAELQALQAQQPVVWTKTDFARIWRTTNGSNRWPSDVDDFVNAVLASPVPPAPTAQASNPEGQVDAAIQTVWEQDEANCADAPRTPHDAFRAGALWALNSRFGPVAGGSDDGDFVLVERGLIGAACAAITRRTDAPKTLAALREITVGAEAPTQKEPVLTDAEIETLARLHGTGGWQTLSDMVLFGKAVLAAAQKEASKP